MATTGALLLRVPLPKRFARVQFTDLALEEPELVAPGTVHAVEEALQTLQKFRQEVILIAENGSFSDNALAFVEEYIARLAAFVGAQLRDSDRKLIAVPRPREERDVDEEEEEEEEIAPFTVTWQTSLIPTNEAAAKKYNQPYTYTSLLYEWVMAGVLLATLQLHRARHLHTRFRKEFNISTDATPPAEGDRRNGEEGIVKERVQLISKWYGKSFETLRYVQEEVLGQWRYPASADPNQANAPETQPWYYTGCQQLISAYVSSAQADELQWHGQRERLSKTRSRTLSFLYLRATALLEAPEVASIHFWTGQMAAQAYTRAMLVLNKMYDAEKDRGLQVAVLELALNRRGLATEHPLYAEVKSRRAEQQIIYEKREFISRDDARLPKVPEYKKISLAMESWSKFVPKHQLNSD